MLVDLFPWPISNVQEFMDRQVKLGEDRIFFTNIRSPLTLSHRLILNLIDLAAHLLALLVVIFSIINW